MKIRHIVVMFLTFGSTSIAAQAQVDLRWKFKQGETFFVKEENTLKQIMEFNGARSPAPDMTTTTVHSFTVKKAGGEEIVLEQRIESVLVEIKSNAEPRPETRGSFPLSDLLKGSTFTITLDRTGKIQRFEGYDEFARKFAKYNENAARMLKATLTEPALKTVLERTFAFQPGKPVLPGDTWKRDFKLPFGPMGVFQETDVYEFRGKSDEGTDRDLYMISVKPQVSYEPPPKDQDSPFPFKIIGGKMSVETGQGSIAFDTEKGRPVHCKMTMKVRGTITVKAGSEEGTVAIEQDQTSDLQVLDKAP